MTKLFTLAEEQALRLILAGNTTRKDIAAATGWKLGTVRTHLRAVYCKAQVHDMTALVLWALNHGYDLPAPHLGVCECGALATRRLRLRVQRNTHEFLVCARCAALEVER